MAKKIIRPAKIVADSNLQKKIWALQEAWRWTPNPAKSKSLVSEYLSSGSLTESQWRAVDTMLQVSFANMQNDWDGEICREYIRNNYGI